MKEATIEALEKVEMGPEERYQIGIKYLNEYGYKSAWAIRMLVRSNKENIVDLIKDLVNHENFYTRDAVQNALSKLIVNSDEQYQFGARYLGQGHFNTRKWAIAILAKTKREDVLGLIAQGLEENMS